MPRMKIWIVLGTLGLVALAGCDNSADGSGGSGGTGGSTAAAGKSQQPFSSGSRLKVRKIVGTDGAVQQLGFHDTELNLDCTFQRAEDGSTRCLPTSTLTVDGYWLDAACTTPVIFESKCGAPNFIRVPLDECSGAAAIWGDVKPYAGPLFHSSGPGDCSPSGMATVAFVGGTKMALSSFAEGNEETE